MKCGAEATQKNHFRKDHRCIRWAQAQLSMKPSTLEEESVAMILFGIKISPDRAGEKVQWL